MFRNAISTSSWTLPAFASIMTGLTTREHGVFMSTTVLPDTLVTLAERLRDAGYATGALVMNGILTPGRGFGRGFQSYGMPATPATPVSFCERIAMGLRSEPITVEGATLDVTDAAIKLVRAYGDRPYFLWLHYLDPHLPYTPPPEYVERMNVNDELGFVLHIDSATRVSMDLFGDPARRAWARSLYEGEVRYVDAQIGRFLRALRSAGHYDDTLLIFAVDHGEEFWDHDGFEHGHTLYNELVAVPLIVKLPGSHPGRVVDDYVSVVDVTPTILDLCRLPAPNAPSAVSLRGYLTGESAPSPPARTLYSAGTLFRSNFEAMLSGGWKYIRSTTSDREQLYNLRDDPQERRSLVLEAPGMMARERKRLDDYGRAVEVFRLQRGIQNPSLELDAEEMARLRALGYL
jgi:arylsulfatase A-like enzyme